MNHIVAPRRIRRPGTAVTALTAVAALVLTGCGGSPSFGSRRSQACWSATPSCRRPNHCAQTGICPPALVRFDPRSSQSHTKEQECQRLTAGAGPRDVTP